MAAWYEGGKDDPKLALLTLDCERAEIWLNGSSLVTGAKLLMGVDPKKSYKDKVVCGCRSTDGCSRGRAALLLLIYRASTAQPPKATPFVRGA